MSMLNYLLLDEVRDLQNRISQVHLLSQTRIEDRLGDVDDQLATFRRDLDELALFSRTAVTLLIEKGIFGGDEFVARMSEVDRSDGVEDGQYDDTKVPREE